MLLATYVFATSANALCCDACSCGDRATDGGSCCCCSNSAGDDISENNSSYTLSNACCCTGSQNNTITQTADANFLTSNDSSSTSSISSDKDCDCALNQDNNTVQTVISDNSSNIKLSWAESCRYDTYMPLTICASSAYADGISNPCPTAPPLLSRCVAPRAPADIA